MSRFGIKRTLYGSALFGGCFIAGSLAHEMIDSLRHRNDGVTISLSQPKSTFVSYNEQIIQNAKTLEVKHGEPFSLYKVASDYDGIRETRLFVNGELKEADNRDYYFDERGFYPRGMLGERNFFGKSLNYFSAGRNTLRYEMEDTKGNIYQDNAEVVVN